MFSVVPVTVKTAGGEETVSSLSAYVGPAGEVICEVSLAALAAAGLASASRESVPASIAARRRGFGST